MSNKRVNPFKLKLHLLECEADEKDKKISDLKTKLAEMTKKYELASCPTGGLVDRVRNLELQLEESESKRKSLEEKVKFLTEETEENFVDGQKYNQLKQQLAEKDQYKILFAIEELEKVLVLIHNAVNIDSPEYDLVGLYDAVRNQINKLKEMK